MRFTASDFADGSYGGAAGKAKTANAIIRFIESGFARAKFTRQAYSGGLMYMFSHIAHYDIHGFFSTWFEDDRNILEWLEYVARSPIYGDNDCTLAEVERVVQKYVRESGLIETYRQHVADVQEARERGQLAALKAKYEGSN